MRCYCTRSRPFFGPRINRLARYYGIQQNKISSTVQERLGHKSVLTTTIYTHLINFEADSYNSETAQTIEEAKKLVEAGFEYVCDVEGFKLFRKLK